MNSRPLSPCAQRILSILRDPFSYEAPYGVMKGLMLTTEWVPVTYLHYEAGLLGRGAMTPLAEIETRGIRIEWSAPEGVRGARVRLA